MSPEERLDKRKIEVNKDEVPGDDDWQKFGEENDESMKLSPEMEEQAAKRKVVRNFLTKESTQN
jgi:hypothetical protein